MMLERLRKRAMKLIWPVKAQKDKEQVVANHSNNMNGLQVIKIQLLGEPGVFNKAIANK